MGMYTAFHFASELKKEIPEEVIEVLKFMNTGENKPETLPNHDFFKTERWFCLFRMDSYYFDAETHSSFRFNEISGSYYLTVTSNLKNYDSEIELFVEWITPYLQKFDGEFLGYSRYEETEEPNIIKYSPEARPLKRL